MKLDYSKHYDTSFDRTDQKCRRSDYCYANDPKFAASPNDMPLSIQRMDIIGALCNFLFWDICI